MCAHIRARSDQKLRVESLTCRAIRPCAPTGEDVKLEVLNLRGNQLGDEGALLLAAALHSNKSIRTLDLSNIC